MTISRIKQIKRILAEHDVRDPRGALQAIATVVEQKKPAAEKPPKPLFNMTLDRVGNKTTCTIQFDREKLEPGHVVKGIDLLNKFGSDVFGGECDDPDCPVHGENKVTGLDELFKKFEAEAQKAAKKGNLQ
jgi:hypothetical protein